MVSGYVLGMSQTAEIALSPYILRCRSRPRWRSRRSSSCGSASPSSQILVAVLIVFFPIMVNVLTAIRLIDRDLINLARSFTASRLQVFWKIEFRAAMPSLFAGLRIGSTLAVIGVVVASWWAAIWGSAIS